jgi:hypothetical protein
MLTTYDHNIVKEPMNKYLTIIGDLVTASVNINQTSGVKSKPTY